MPPKRAGPDGMKKTVRTTTTTAQSAAGKKIVKKVQTITTTEAPAQKKKPSTAKATTIVQAVKKQTSQASSQWNLPQNLAAPNPSPAPFTGFTAQTSFTFSDPNRPGTILPTPSVNPFVWPHGSYTAPKPAGSYANPVTIEGSNGKPVASTGNAKNFVWLIYYRSGHQRSADLIGVYTTEKRALKNAKALIDRETGGAATRVMNGVAFIDNSADLEAVGEEGTIYEAKYGNGGKNVVSFTKIRLNEDYC